MKIYIGLVDDHQLFIKSLSLLLNSLEGCEVVIEALSGKQLQEKILLVEHIPDIMLIDVNMDGMNGVEVATWLNEKYPLIRLIALSMNDKDKAITDMFRAGCCAYLLKDMHPVELENAVREVHDKGYYSANAGNINFSRLLANADAQRGRNITGKELQFLQLACSDLTYKQIADIMHVTERTVDGYRESLFQKLDVKSRVGLCLEAIRKELIKL
jgi:DNA-binding NarL/FixJ family response regulator